MPVSFSMNARKILLIGDVSEAFVDYTHAESFAHSRIRFAEGPVTLPPFLVRWLLCGVESFPCMEDRVSTPSDALRYRPLLPVPVRWAGLTIFRRSWRNWLVLTVLSLLVIICRMASDRPTSLGKRLAWMLVTILLGPIVLLAYLVTRKTKRRAIKAA